MPERNAIRQSLSIAPHLVRYQQCNIQKLQDFPRFLAVNWGWAEKSLKFVYIRADKVEAWLG